MAFHDLGANGNQHALDALVTGLLGGSRQRLLDRDTGLDQRCQLPGNQGQVRRAQAAAPAQRIGANLLFRGRLDRQRRQPPLPQLLANGAGTVSLQYTLLLSAAGSRAL